MIVQEINSSGSDRHEFIIVTYFEIINILKNLDFQTECELLLRNFQ